VSSKLVAGSVKSVNGKNSDVIKEGRFAGVQALSGTGYCSLFAEFQKHCCPESPMYLPDPTWSKQVCLVSSVISQVLSLKRLLAMREVFLVLYKQPRSSSPN
jgi:aspartate/tyrosine/aromatic aminotransferase